MNLDEALGFCAEVTDGEIEVWTPDHVEALRLVADHARATRDAWAPIRRRWRDIVPGDSFVDEDGQLWHVGGISAGGPAASVTVHNGARTVDVRDLDPDDTEQVLVPLVERDALRLARDQLKARMGDRRTT